jgi:hypothetical protein
MVRSASRPHHDRADPKGRGGDRIFPVRGEARIETRRVEAAIEPWFETPSRSRFARLDGSSPRTGLSRRPLDRASRASTDRGEERGWFDPLRGLTMTGQIEDRGRASRTTAPHHERDFRDAISIALRAPSPIVVRRIDGSIRYAASP